MLQAGHRPRTKASGRPLFPGPSPGKCIRGRFVGFCWGYTSIPRLRPDWRTCFLLVRLFFHEFNLDMCFFINSTQTQKSKVRLNTNTDEINSKNHPSMFFLKTIVFPPWFLLFWWEKIARSLGKIFQGTHRPSPLNNFEASTL